MLVSIVVNNYNYARFLGECIESALAQTHPSVEVIAVDDGSTDPSRAVIERFGSRVRPVFKPNGGQGSAYNAGFGVSRGEAVCFLDADDVLIPRAVELLVPLLQAHGVSKAQWPLRVVDAEGHPTGRQVPARVCVDGDLRAWVVRNGPFYDFDLTPGGSGTAYPRWFLERVLPMPEPPFVNGADVYLLALAPVYGEIRTASEPLGFYRFHGANQYAGRALDDARLSNYLARFEANAAALAEHLRRQGVEPDVAGWRRRNFNSVWPSRLLRARRDVGECVPVGSAYVLIDGGEWSWAEPLPGRRAVPFPECDGEYWGPPADDEAAVAEFERLRSHGVSFAAVWWTAFWWLERYPGLAGLLAARRCVLDADHLLVFDLRVAARPGAGDEVLQRARAAVSEVADPPGSRAS